MNNVKNNLRKDFTITPNELINDDSLTPQARFLFTYMASKPDDWKFVQEPMAKNFNWSLPTLRKYLKELLAAGWISRERSRDEGKIVYRLTAQCDHVIVLTNPQPPAQ